MVEMYEEYKKVLLSRKVILTSILLLFILGLLFGSLYVTVLSDSEKKDILFTVEEYFNSYKSISFSSKLEIFKSNLTSNLLYFFIIWCLGLCIIGLPIIFIMIFFKSFTIGFSISSIYIKYKLKGLLGILIYIFPSITIYLILSILLGCFSTNISLKLVKESFTKKNLNFASFMGRYFFLMVLIILTIIICSLFDAFISPILYKWFLNWLNMINVIT